MRKKTSAATYDTKETRGYWKFEEEALDLTLWRCGFGPVVRQTVELIN